jgi:DNA-binding NarL/FixJ family response regulator
MMNEVKEADLMKVLLAIDNSKGILDRIFQMTQSIAGVDSIITLIKVKEIIESVRCLQPDVLVMDLYLLDGAVLDVMKEMRSVKKKPTMMILTEQPYTNIEDYLKVAGADFVLNKSLEFELIVKILSRLSEKHKENPQQLNL